MMNTSKEKNRKRTASPEALQRLKRHLEDLHALLPPRATAARDATDEARTTRNVGMAIQTTVAEAEEDEFDEEFLEYDLDEKYPEDEPLESEELEAAVDELLTDMSQFMEDGKEPKSLQQLFEKLFGTKSKSTIVAVELEDAINGYLGFVFGKDLESAHESLRALIEFVNRKVERWKT